MISLPWEIWSMVFQYFREDGGSYRDIVSLALSGREMYDVVRQCPLEESIVETACLSWSEIPEVLDLVSCNEKQSNSVKSRIVRGVLESVLEIRIEEGDGRAQWQRAGDLAKLASKCPNLSKLRVASVGGSGWLRELQPSLDGLIELDIFAIGRSGGKKGSLSAMIYAEHVKAGAPNIKSLSLSGVNIYGSQGIGFLEFGSISCGANTSINGKESDGPDYLHSLEALTLTNCQWGFPYRLDELGPIKTITIRIAYSYLLNNAQMREMLVDPPNTCQTLTLDVGMTDMFGDEIRMAKAWREELTNKNAEKEKNKLAQERRRLFPNNVVTHQLIIHSDKTEESRVHLEFDESDKHYRFVFGTSKHEDRRFYII